MGIKLFLETRRTLKLLVGIICCIDFICRYHLLHRPGNEVLEQAGGLHKFESWNRNLLTDSGGFQIVSLSKLVAISEEGVSFCDPHSGIRSLLTPEESIHAQVGQELCNTC